MESRGSDLSSGKIYLDDVVLHNDSGTIGSCKLYKDEIRFLVESFKLHNPSLTTTIIRNSKNKNNYGKSYKPGGHETKDPLSS